MLDWILGWIRKIRDWFTLADNILDWGEKNFPGLYDVIYPIINYTWDMVGQDNMTKDEAREYAVDEAKDQLTASPRFVPEWVIRAFVEAIVGKFKQAYMSRTGTVPYYYRERVKERAHQILKGRRG